MAIEGTGVMPVMDIAGHNNEWANCAMWNNPFMYLIFMGMFNGGMWGNRGGYDYVSQAQLAQGLDNQDKNSQLRGVTYGLADLGYAVNNSIKDTGAGVAKAVADVGTGMQMGFCTTNHNIDNLKFENAKNTEYIVNNGHADTQRIIDKLCGMELNAIKAENLNLRQALSEAKLDISQRAQSDYLVEKLTPAT